MFTFLLILAVKKVGFKNVRCGSNGQILPSLKLGNVYLVAVLVRQNHLTENSICHLYFVCMQGFPSCYR